METPDHDLPDNQPKEGNQVIIHHPDVPDKSLQSQSIPAPQLEIFPDWTALCYQKANERQPGKSSFYENF